MKAVCVKPNRELEVREIPAPAEPAPGHVLIDMDSSAINHGDKTFLAHHGDKTFLARTAPAPVARSPHEVWGHPGRAASWRPARALRRSLPASRSRSIDRWLGAPMRSGSGANARSLSCVILPDAGRARDYCGSLVNVITAYAFLEQIHEEGHKGIVVTAGNSASGRAMLALARRRGTPALFLVRSASAREELHRLGAQHTLLTTEDGFERRFATLAEQL